MRKSILLSLVLVIVCYPLFCQELALSAPVVGIPTPEVEGNLMQAKISLHATNVKGIKIEVKFGQKGKSQRTIAMNQAPRGKEYPTAPPFTAVMDKLVSGAEYQYEILMDGRPMANREKWQGRFHTPAASSPITVAVASCAKYQYDKVQPGWLRLLGLNPDFLLFIGDCVYADTTDHTKLWEWHLKQRSVENFRKVLLNMPVAALWDDHDFGPNNSNGTEPGKNDSLTAFKEVWWSNPTFGTADTPGIFTRFSWGNVHFYILDGRYHRSDPWESDRVMLGKAQMDWLIGELKAQQLRDDAARTPSFKVLISGSVLTDNPIDGWSVYAKERRELFERIVQEQISGIVYCGGDVHLSYLNKHGVDIAGGYPIYEAVSSGIAYRHVLYGDTESFALLKFDTMSEDYNHHKLEMTIHGKQERMNFDRSKSEIIYLKDIQIDKSKAKTRSGSGKFLFDRKSEEFKEKKIKGQLTDEYSAPLPEPVK